jgi:hypothetical protein
MRQPVVPNSLASRNIAMVLPPAPTNDTTAPRFRRKADRRRSPLGMLKSSFFWNCSFRLIQDATSRPVAARILRVFSHNPCYPPPGSEEKTIRLFDFFDY